jgi:membrane protease YdiL (CAAX protease family)
MTVPITVAFFAETTNLMVYSYMTLYLIAIFLLGFYITLSERIAIPPSPQKKVNIIEQPHAKKESPSKLHRKSFLNFYLFVFISWQGINILFYILSVPIKILSYASLMAQTCYFAILVLLIKRNGSNLTELGYVWPEAGHKYIFCSLFLGVFYSFITIFLPGFFTGYEVFPSPSVANILNAVFFAVIFSFISESIFRGYIQAQLVNLASFPRALLVTSILFTLYALPLVPFDMFRLFHEFTSFFLIGIILGILFYKTKTLLSPIFLYSTLLTLEALTPIGALALNYVKPLVEFVAIAFVLTLLSIIVKKGPSDLNLLEILPEK